ncbi:hypothetical protein E0J16_34085 [Rhizobium pisi]|uniref:hypothetical protein n=1 Tax=Rhizobium pisi TaxID=574561 RepID=UPI00103C88DC|nr:hypothetical protein [Rhizobium pisi]TCA41720.1 hypothetical protein E0J16_34085 [Rhizobium pisi]
MLKGNNQLRHGHCGCRIEFSRLWLSRRGKATTISLLAQTLFLIPPCRLSWHPVSPTRHYVTPLRYV